MRASLVQQSSERVQRGREAHARTNPAWSVAKVGAWDVDLITHVVGASAECKSLFGFSPEEPFDLSRTFSLIHPDFRDAVRKAFESALVNRTAFNIEYCITHPTNGIRWLSSVGMLSDHQPNKMFGVTSDITDRKIATNALSELIQLPQNSAKGT